MGKCVHQQNYISYILFMIITCHYLLYVIIYNLDNLVENMHSKNAINQMELLCAAIYRLFLKC